MGEINAEVRPSQIPSAVSKLRDQSCKMQSRMDLSEKRHDATEIRLESCAKKMAEAQIQIASQFAKFGAEQSRQGAWIKMAAGMAAGMLALCVAVAGKVFL